MHAEVELRNLAEALEQRVAERTAELQDSNERLRRYAAELARSNADLERFAYVSSHDLQEPLRAVASYTQLLARRYQGRLDADADEFIGYVVEGVTRMQQLIRDLLSYARIGAADADMEQVDTGALVDQVIADLSQALGESGATVTRGDLPVVLANASQLRQVFQNVIANAIKFQRDEPLRVEVTAHRTGVAGTAGGRDAADEWRFDISDNGIGVASEYAERIFVIFQRLHRREDYPGSGIGLAICKRIVERHGGRIWVESSPGQGATFSFTLPMDGPGHRRADLPA